MTATPGPLAATTPLTGFKPDSGHSTEHLQVHGVRKSFGGTEVLKGVDLTVAQGRTTAIVGASGSGKTTLLRLIAGFEAPDAGSVALGGADVAGPGAWIPAHKRSVGYVAQDGALFPHLSVGQNIAFGLSLRGKAAASRVAELLEMVSMDPSYAKRKPSQLSGGQQQRVALALVTITVRNVPAIYQTAVVLVAAYALLFMPRALVNLRAGLAQAPRELDEAAQALGKPPLLAFLKVTLRLSAPAAAGGAALVFLGIVNELTATLLLAPNGTNTLATEFWALSSEIDYAGAAPYALLMILLSAPMTYLLFAQSKKAAGQ